MAPNQLRVNINFEYVEIVMNTPNGETETIIITLISVNNVKRVKTYILSAIIKCELNMNRLHISEHIILGMLCGVLP